MPEPLSESQLVSLTERAFGVFDSDPQGWPDIVQFNRSGYTDVNVRGIWTFSERVDFVNVPLPQGFERGSEERPFNPDSSGSAD